MAEPLVLFPARAPIGRADSSGAVYMSPEFQRALAALLTRVGGPVANDLGELALELATSAGAASLAAARGLAELERELTHAVQLSARVGELRKLVAALEAQLVNVPPPTDWEHPGKIGAATPNAARFTTVNRVAITAPANAATFTLTDGKTFSVANTLALTATDGATLNIGGGGTLGTAAYAAASTFAARSATALAVAATDAASTQALANSIRSVLLSVGIGT